MEFRKNPVRLIINADDFGRSRPINEAVIRAHREGVLTTTSLMVNESDCNEAVQMAKQNPRLGVGLHLAVVCGKSALPHARIPGLTNEAGEFSDNAVSSGMRFFFNRDLEKELFEEINMQFKKFQATGLVLDHVNGHLNTHLHPTIFRILMHNAERWGIRHMRLTYDDFWLNARLASGSWMYRASHAFIYRMLSAQSRPILAAKKIKHTERVFGLLQNARVDEAFIAKLLPELPAGDSELYSHPSLDEFKYEFEALISPKVKDSIQKLGIQLIRYQDL
ncbi:MAG: hopanoid biosynthesis-associated protein HpnK [Verrucomicrobia bacterium]|nr:hopanoid biosynthesis-associated protein HpnK [Verrucomicrobiota bacterium]